MCWGGSVVARGGGREAAGSCDRGPMAVLGKRKAESDGAGAFAAAGAARGAARARAGGDGSVWWAQGGFERRVAAAAAAAAQAEAQRVRGRPVVAGDRAGTEGRRKAHTVRRKMRNLAQSFSSVLGGRGGGSRDGGGLAAAAAGGGGGKGATQGIGAGGGLDDYDPFEGFEDAPEPLPAVVAVAPAAAVALGGEQTPAGATPAGAGLFGVEAPTASAAKKTATFGGTDFGADASKGDAGKSPLGGTLFGGASAPPASSAPLFPPAGSGPAAGAPGAANFSIGTASPAGGLFDGVEALAAGAGGGSKSRGSSRVRRRRGR